ncbi:hypothetical protein [Bacillus sp. T33-2]|uniref:hypothetical protein n=1 Tax=Bacillus sp. T33-2 TaxID=2054168 RepID=UPI000C77C8C7|nr:hypothetical protein [Bacillus sp. T33-2]PLR99231.1 hypothetical protein CVD19_02625 [Bacillus sp. T33-2]
MPRILLSENGNTKFEKALSLVPEVKTQYDRLYDFLWEEQELSGEVKEKIRLYLANLNGCATCMSLSYLGRTDWNEEISGAIRTGDFRGFPELYQKLFAFISQYRTEPHSLADEQITGLKEYFTDRQIIKLLALINLFDGFHKIIVSLDLYDFCSIGKENVR